MDILILDISSQEEDHKISILNLTLDNEKIGSLPKIKMRAPTTKDV
jgi:hypothetical protein